MYDLLIKDATTIHDGRRQVTDIAITDGTIVYVGDRPGGRARQTISAIGRFVAPGAIDMSVSLSATGGVAENWSTVSRAAAAAGVTTLIAQTGAADATALDACEASAASSMVSHGHWGLATAGNALVLSSLWAAGRICGAHVDMAHLSASALAAHYATSIGLIGAHTGGVAGIDSLIPLIRATDRSTHIFCLSTAAELELLDTLHGDLPLTTDITPNHLFLSVETIGRIKSSLRCHPPIRPELDRRAMWTAIKRGRIDCFASGHTPIPRTPMGTEAPIGLPGMDTFLKLLMFAVASGRMSLEVMVEMCAGAPARILGLVDKGRLEEGADADLILFSEGQTSKLTTADLYSAAGWSPFTGRTLAAPPQVVIVGGRVVSEEGRIVAESPAPPVRYRHAV